MEFVIVFFRDILNGPLYIITSVIAGILICSCIGYLAEQTELKKKEEQEVEYFSVDALENSDINNNVNNNINNSTNNVNTGVANQNNVVSNTSDIQTRDV